LKGIKVPLFYQQNINDTTKLAIWKIEEAEEFFTAKVPLSRTIAHPHKRLQHLAGRYLLPYLFPDFPYHEIEIADTRKPFLPNEDFHFSISHCRDYAAAIVSRNNRVGVDIELVTPRVGNIKNKFLHPAELRFVNSQLVAEHLKLLTVLWCAKEAIYKWYGLGEVDFSDMMRTFPFQLMDKGEIEAGFIKGAFQKKLTLQYQMMEGLSLVWLISD
jgi:phosphopantetheinyl transferase